MTEEQALAKAKHLWGPQAYVLDRFTLKHEREKIIRRVGRYYVGCPDLSLHFPFGNGNSWEEAFENAAKH